MSFPSNYPNSPPSVRFTSEIWHPNGEYLSSVSEFLNLIFSLSLSWTVGLMSWVCLNCSLLRWKGLHFNSSSPWWWSKWLWASKRTLESSPYSTFWFFKMFLSLFHPIYSFSPLLWIEFLLIHYIFVFLLGLDLVIINSSTLTAFSAMAHCFWVLWVCV